MRRRGGELNRDGPARPAPGAPSGATGPGRGGGWRGDGRSRGRRGRERGGAMAAEGRWRGAMAELAELEMAVKREAGRMGRRGG